MRTQRTYRGMPSSTRTYFYFSDMTNVIFSHKQTNDFLSSSIDYVSSLVHALLYFSYALYFNSSILIALSLFLSMSYHLSLSLCLSLHIFRSISFTVSASLFFSFFLSLSQTHSPPVPLSLCIQDITIVITLSTDNISNNTFFSSKELLSLMPPLLVTF